MPHTFPTPHPWRFSLPFPHDTQATETFFAKCQVSVVVVDEIIFWPVRLGGVPESRTLAKLFHTHLEHLSGDDKSCPAQIQ